MKILVSLTLLHCGIVVNVVLERKHSEVLSVSLLLLYLVAHSLYRHLEEKAYEMFVRRFCSNHA